MQGGVICVVGEVDRAALEVLNETCRGQVMAGTPVVQVDFAAMTGCPSALLLALTDMGALARAHGSRLVVMDLLVALLGIVQEPPTPARAGDRTRMS